MATEASRAIIRIGANYARLGATFVLGIVLVPVLLGALGEDGFGLVALLGSSVGIAAMFQEITQQSLNRELGGALHDPDPAVFPVIYNSAYAVTLVAAMLSALAFGALALAAPLFEMPPELLNPARVFILWKGVHSSAAVLLAPTFNLYIVREKFLFANLWMVLDRAGLLAAAAILLALGVSDTRGVGVAIVAYGAISALLSIAVVGVAVAMIFVREPAMRPRPTRATRAGVRSVLHTGFWNTLASVATNMHIRLDAIIINLQLGVFGNLLFGLAVQLTSYARMLTTGMTAGVDAVAARVGATRGDQGVRSLLRQSTRLHALAAFPAGIAMAMLAEPIIRVWVGARLDDPDATAPLAAAVVRILAVGMVVRSVSDGWVRLLYGAGHVRRVAPLIVAGGICNPVLAGALILLLPESVKYTAVAWAFSGALVAFHLGGIPIVTARCVDAPVREILAPCARPLLIAVAPAPLIWYALRSVESWSLLWLAGVLAGYAAIVAIGTLCFGATAGERARVVRALRRRLVVRHR